MIEIGIVYILLGFIMWIFISTTIIDTPHTQKSLIRMGKIYVVVGFINLIAEILNFLLPYDWIYLIGPVAVLIAAVFMLNEMKNINRRLNHERDKIIKSIRDIERT